MKAMRGRRQRWFPPLKRASAVLGLACGLLLTASCRKETVVATGPPAPSLDSDAIASVQGNVIREESYRRKLTERIERTGRTGARPSLAEKTALLEEMIRREAVYAKAMAAKFDEQPEVAALIKDLVISRFLEQQMGTAAPAITTREIEEYYRNHGAEFATPEAVRGAAIFLRAGARMTPERRQALEQRARLILAEAERTETEADFVRLVQRHSEQQETRYRGGDLGWLTRAQCESAFGTEVSSALFALSKPNEFAPLLETSEGYWILQLRERKGPGARSLAEVAEVIRYRLTRQRQGRCEEEFYARMKTGLDVRVNQRLLESISIPSLDPNQPGPPGLPATGSGPKVATR